MKRQPLRLGVGTWSGAMVSQPGSARNCKGRPSLAERDQGPEDYCLHLMVRRGSHEGSVFKPRLLLGLRRAVAGASVGSFSTAVQLPPV